MMAPHRVAFLLLLLLEKAQGLNVSQKCMMDTDTFLWEINQDRPKEYAVHMYDAFGKMGSNVEGGNVNQPGLLQQCHSAHSPTFSGQYCQVFLRQGTIQYFVGICVPDSCQEEEVNLLVLHGKFQLGQTSLICPLPHILVNQSTQEMIMTQCLSNNIKPDVSDIICLFVCCIMVAVPLAATLFTAIIMWQRKREVSPTVESSSINSGLKPYGTMKTTGSSTGEINSSTSEAENSSRHGILCFSRSCVYRWLQAFSLQTTSQGVLSTIPQGGYASLNGIRVLTLLWVACEHTAQFPIGESLVDNYKSWKKTAVGNPVHLLTIGGPVFLGVDTFLLLGVPVLAAFGFRGMLSARSLLASIHKAENKLCSRLVADYLFKRIKRVQPLHLFIVCFTIAVISVVQLGAYQFPFVDIMVNCKTNWWTNLLLINNLIPFEQICLPWTWYLSLDFQCYATTPLLVYFYRLNRGVFAVVSGILLLITTVSGAVITAHLQLPVSMTSSMTSQNYFLNYYAKPYTRYGPFLIGILTGIYLTTKQEKLLKQKWQAALGWFCCLSLVAVIVGAAYILQETPAYPSVPHALYQGLHRLLWTLAVTWIILACEEGYGGFINSLLSSRFWLPLSSISFACYLTHPVLILLYISLQDTPFHYTDFNFMHLFLSHVVLMSVVSYVLTVLVEKPYALLKWSTT